MKVVTNVAAAALCVALSGCGGADAGSEPKEMSQSERTECQAKFGAFQSFVSISEVVAMERGRDAAVEWVIQKSRESGMSDQCIKYLSTQ
jgi:hypothetical protein